MYCLYLDVAIHVFHVKHKAPTACYLLRPASIDLLFLGSSCTLIIHKSWEKTLEIDCFEIDNFSKNGAFSCIFFACFFFHFYFYSSWPSEIGLGNNTSIKSGINKPRSFFSVSILTGWEDSSHDFLIILIL